MKRIEGSAKELNGDLDRLSMLTWIMFLKLLDDMERIEEGRVELGGNVCRPTDALRLKRKLATRDDAYPASLIARKISVRCPGGEMQFH